MKEFHTPLPGEIIPLESPAQRATDHIMQFFSYEHLPAHLQEVSRPFATLANHIVTTLPRNPERTVALHSSIAP